LHASIFASQKSFADPEANMMMTGEGSLQYCYNAQVATSEDGVIVAAEVTTAPRDVHQLVPMVEAVKANTGCRPGIALADNGYLSESNLEQLHRKRQRCLVAAGREGKKPTSWPQGRYTQRMHRLLRLPWARRIYDYRKTQGERPFAEIEQTMRFRRFSLRGRCKHPGRVEPGVRCRQCPDPVPGGDGMSNRPRDDCALAGDAWRRRLPWGGAHPTFLRLHHPPQDPLLSATPGSGS
jgi:hypothetical protein